MKKNNIIIIAGVVVVLSVLIIAGLVTRKTGDATQAGEDVAAYYKGKIVKWIIPYSPGGGYDEYARLLSPYLSKYTGARVDVLNLPGAGGMRGVNELYSSPNDGLIIGMINGSALVTSELAGITGANYKLDQFAYLGRIVADARVLVVSKQSGLNTFEDMINAQTPLKVGATGLGGSTYVDVVVSKEAFKLNIEIIHGFDSSSVVRQEMLRGNIVGTWGSYGSAEEGVDEGAETIILQSGNKRLPDLQDVPTAFEYVDKTEDPARTKAILTAWDALIAVGRSVAAPPGISPARLEFLRAAFKSAMQDPELIALAQKSGRPFDFANGDEIHQITRNATMMPPDIKELFIKAIKGEL